MVGALAEHTWIGVAAVIAAIGSAASAIISALNGRKIDKLNGNGQPAKGDDGEG